MNEYISIFETIEKPVSGEWGIEPSNGYAIKVLRNTNFSNDGSLNLKDVVEREIPISKISQKKLIYGDILIEKSGGSPAQPVGRVVFFDQVDGDYLFSNFTSALRPKKGIFPKYLFYLLYANHLFKKTLTYQNKTTGILNLQLDRYLKETKIPLPPLPEQQRIATILDHADSIRSKNRQIIEKYDELAKSVFYEMFGDPVRNPNMWITKKLKEVCEKITDGTHHSPPISNIGVPYVTAKHIKKSGLNFESQPTYISDSHHAPIYKRCPAEYGDVLYIKDGATTGIAAINTFKQEISLLSSLALLKPDYSQISNIYLSYWLNNDNVKSKLLEGNMSGAAIQRFTLNKIKDFDIQIPNFEIQIKFSDIVNNIDKQRKLTQKSLNKTEELFQSLLQRAFKAEL